MLVLVKHIFYIIVIFKQNTYFQNLHCFGDVDGKQYSAKLQHPLGVAWNKYESMLYVADTYNHKIKKVDIEGNCSTVYENGKPTTKQSVSFLNMRSLLKRFTVNNNSMEKNILFQLDEPSGLSVNSNGDILYIADTNNHCIKALNLKDLKNIDLVSINLFI